MASTPPPVPGNPGGNVPPPGGAWQGVYQAGGPPPMVAPPKKGLGPVAWILIILGGLFATFMILMIAGGLFLIHKAKQAGLDPALMQKNPALATAKLITAFNPDAEIVSVDENRGTITIRNKKTGKTITMNAGDVKNGKISFATDGKDSVTFTASGAQNGGIEVKGNGETVRIGAGPITLPSWLPNYPGSAPEASAVARSKDSNSSQFTFKTHDAPDKIISFYHDAFSGAGMKESANVNTPAMSMVAGADPDKKREVAVMVTPAAGESTVLVTFSDRH